MSKLERDKNSQFLVGNFHFSEGCGALIMKYDVRFKIIDVLKFNKIVKIQVKYLNLST